MRILWIVVALMSLSIGAKANHEKAAIVIKTNGHTPIIVQLDGHRSQQSPRASVQLNNLRPGHHYVKIFRIGGHGQNGHYGHAQRELIYSGPVRLRSGFKMVYKLHHGHLDLIDQRPLYAHGAYHGNGHGGQGGHGGHQGHGHGGHGSSHGYGTGHGGHGGHDGGHGNGHGSQSGGNGHNGPGGWDGPRPNYFKPMSNSDFQYLINRSKTHFVDAGKVDFFLDELEDERVSIRQVRQMSDELFFEAEKYKLLTSAMDRSTEPEQYDQLASVFTFNNTKQDFKKYVEAQNAIERSVE